MHNESKLERSEEDVVKISKLQKVKNATITTGIFVIPSAVFAGSIYYSVKITRMNLEIAQLNHAAALAKTVVK